MREKKENKQGNENIGLVIINGNSDVSVLKSTALS